MLKQVVERRVFVLSIHDLSIPAEAQVFAKIGFRTLAEQRLNDAEQIRSKEMILIASGRNR